MCPSGRQWPERERRSLSGDSVVARTHRTEACVEFWKDRWILAGREEEDIPSYRTSISKGKGVESCSTFEKYVMLNNCLPLWLDKSGERTEGQDGRKPGVSVFQVHYAQGCYDWHVRPRGQLQKRSHFGLGKISAWQ